MVYKSTPGKGSIEADFESEWNELVLKNNTITAGPQKSEVQEAEGWKIISGGGKAIFNKADMMVLLTTFSGYNTCISILAKTNSADYLKMIEDFNGSIELKLPATIDKVAPNNISYQATTPSTYAFTSSNFDDGWSSTIYDDYVLVTKGSTHVYLNFTVPYNASQFSGTGATARDFYWDNVVTKQFNIINKQYNDGNSMAMTPDYVEGWATDKRTGKKCFIGMRLAISPNAANVIIGSAQDENSFRQQFPKANDNFVSDLAAMDRYNKFAISANDMIGQWEKGSSNTMQWAYVSPSGYEGYAGMTVAATSAVFNFNSDGSYSSTHNGATGSVGNMNTFQQEYKGKYDVTNWVVTATNRFGGKTSRFDAYFVAVKGGRILMMSEGGQTYQLVRTK